MRVPYTGRVSREEPTAPAGLVLREELPADRTAILALTAQAFAVSPATGLRVEGEPFEVEVLRRLFDSKDYIPTLSVVGLLGHEIVGHVISTRGWVGSHRVLGLGPLGVLPRLQRRGIGSALMQESIARANAAGESGIALLGSTLYYPRFGFVPARTVGVLPPEDAWGAHFQLLPLNAWCRDIQGTFRFAGAFTRP
ncbi:putative N-acetyltransferase YhbS [Arthrobacter ulcerisalmonis]|nr:putative N-acetyltransferase YhbS [Arthrobacter ulcerisalmonis]